MHAAFYLATFLVSSWYSPRYNLEILFLKAQVIIMKTVLRRHGIQYPVLEPSEKAELLRFGADLDHKVKDIFFINTWATYRHWVAIQQSGGVLKKPGRLKVISQTVRDLVVRLAKENLEWGFTRIAGELKKLGEAISAATVKRILKSNGIDPTLEKGRRVSNGQWRKFIAAHMDCTVAVDLFTSKLATIRGIFLAYSIVFLHHGSRKVWISYPTLNPDEAWLNRQLVGAFWWFEEQGIKPRYLIRDRDGKYSAKFDELVKELTGHKRAVVKTSRRAPDMNAYAESQIGHMKSECHNHYWLFRSLDQLGHANSEYMHFHNRKRPHQSLDNSVPDPDEQPPPCTGDVRCEKILGGLLRHYYRVAA